MLNIFTKRNQPEPVTGSTYLIVGLGNPGRDYRGTRHNIGFMVIDQLAKDLGVSFSRVQSNSLVVQAIRDGKKIILAKPHTYMNLSGQAVGSLVKFYKLPLTQMLVAHDDIDLPIGTLRMRPGGGSAGQKGLESIIGRLGTQEFPRLRIGVGRPPGRMIAADYVLQEFSKAERELLPAILERASEAALVFTDNGLEQAMNRFNGELSRE